MPSRIVRRSGNCQVDKLGKRPRSDLFHGCGTVGLDSPLADSQDVSDLFVRIALDNHFYGRSPKVRLAIRFAAVSRKDDSAVEFRVSSRARSMLTTSSSY